MRILYLLIPISLLLLGLILWILFWAVRSGQFDDLEGPAHRILMDEERVVDRSGMRVHSRQKKAGEEVPAKLLK